MSVGIEDEIRVRSVTVITGREKRRDKSGTERSAGGDTAPSATTYHFNIKLTTITLKYHFISSPTTTITYS